MKTDRYLTGLTGMVLAFSLSLGSVLSLATGFSLTLEDPVRLIVLSLAASCFTAFSLVFPKGGILVLLAGAMALGYLWNLGEPLSQAAALVTRISRVYNQAYHWGYLALSDSWRDAFCDWPLLFLAGGIILAVSWAVCRGRGTWAAVLSSVFPAALCLVVTDTVPSGACLFVLLSGLAVLILTSGIRRENRRQAGQLTAMAVVPVLAFCALLFLSFPQEHYVNRAAGLRTAIVQWGSEIPEQLVNTAGQLSQELPQAHETELDLTRVGPQRELRYPVMDLTSQTGGRIYLREQDFDTYTGTGWYCDDSREESLMGPAGTPDTVTIQTRREQELLFVPWYPAGEVQLSGGRAENTAGTKEYILNRILPENIAAPADGRSGDLSRYTQLPDATREKGQSLLYGTLSDQVGVRENARRIGQAVASSARYDLDALRMPEGEEDFALWFLSSCDRGYCIHFATAATVLLRSAGIPARYVTGYLVTANPGETVTVTAGQAHAWAEYYEEETGLWQILEATPAAEEPVQTLPAVETAPVPEDAPGISPSAPAAPEKKPVAENPKPDSVPVLPFLAAVLLLAVLIGQRFVRLSWRRRELERSPVNRQALLLWQEAVRLAGRLGEAPPESLHQLAQKARFSQYTLEQTELEAFYQQLQASRLRLKEQPWYRKLMDQYWFAAY